MAIEEAKTEQAQKEYIAKRKRDCLDIYKAESSKWSNVLEWRYSETDDQCLLNIKTQILKVMLSAISFIPLEVNWTEVINCI
jgi:hypothetical protein